MGKELKLQVLLAAIDKASAPLKAIMGASDGATRGLKEARRRLKELEQANARMDAFRQTSRDLAVTGNALQQATAKVAQLKQEMAASTSPTKAQNRALQEAIRTAGQLKDRNQVLAEKQQRLRTELELAGTPTRELARHQKDLQGKIKTATTALAEQEKALKRHGETMRKMADARAQYEKSMETRNKIAGAGVSMMATGGAMGTPVVKAVRDFATLESAITQLKVSMMDASGTVSTEFDLIAKKAVDLGGKLPGTTEEFVRVATMLKNQGMDAKDILNGGLESASYLGVLLDGDKERVAEIVAKAREAHGLSGAQLPQAADLIQRAKTGFGLSPDQIYEAMKYVATDLNAKGMVGSIDHMKQFLAIEGVMAQKGNEGSSFGTNFAHMLKSMAMAENKLEGAKGAEGQYVRGLLEAQKIKFNFFKDGQFAGFENMVAELERLKVFSDQDQERILKKLFDTEGMRPALSLLKNGVAGFKEAIATMDAQASLEERIKLSLETLGNTYEAMGGSANKLSTTLGATLAPTLTTLFNAVGGVLEKVSQWAEENPKLTSFIMHSVAIIGALLVVVGGLGVAIAAVIGPLAMLRYGFAMLSIGGAGPLSMLMSLGKTVLPMVGNAILFIGRALLMNPIGLLITAIAGAAFLIYRYWGPISTFFSGLWTNVTTFARTAWGGLTTWFAALPAQMLIIGGQIIDGLWQGLAAKWEGLKAKVAEIANSISGAVKGALGIHSPSRVFAELGGYTMQGLQMGLQKGGKGPLESVKALAGQLATAGAITMGATGQVMAAPMQIVAQGVQPAIEALQPAAQAIRPALEIMQPTFQAVQPLQSIAVDNRPPIAATRADGGGGGVSIVNHFHISPTPGMDEAQLARLVAEEVERVSRRSLAASRSRLTDSD